MNNHECCILNAGGGSWAFETLARQLSRALWVDVSETPRQYNYLLLADDPSGLELFTPFASLELAADKRAVARAFAAHAVPTPETHLAESLAEAERIASRDPGRRWCLKYPTGCGASGHRMLEAVTHLPDGWPTPLVLQEFVAMQRPEVFRLYGAGGRTFGWVARRFPPNVATSPWVAHARGARYTATGEPPASAVAAATAALSATGLLGSFGCADLIQRPTGEWLVLEVGSDGMFNHVDRDLDLPAVEHEIQSSIADAFWARVGSWRPWGSGQWQPRSPAEA